MLFEEKAGTLPRCPDRKGSKRVYRISPQYRNEFVDYIARHGYTGIHALVAFSGKVTLDGKEYTEEVMNGISEEDLPEVFGTDSYQVLLVANKYQTGFDQPKLCAMYVDKRLRGVAAVQTLSRLNRICAPYNKKTFVLDFKNTYEDIQNAFAPYYTETVLNKYRDCLNSLT